MLDSKRSDNHLGSLALLDLIRSSKIRDIDFSSFYNPCQCYSAARPPTRGGEREGADSSKNGQTSSTAYLDASKYNQFWDMHAGSITPDLYVRSRWKGSILGKMQDSAPWIMISTRICQAYQPGVRGVVQYSAVSEDVHVRSTTCMMGHVTRGENESNEQVRAKWTERERGKTLNWRLRLTRSLHGSLVDLFACTDFKCQPIGHLALN